MGAHSFSPFPPLGAPGAAIGRLRGQFTPLFLIAAVHVLVLYGVYSGLLHRVRDGMPVEVFVSLLAATPPAPSEPELVPLAEVPPLAPPDVTVPVTVIDIAPAQPVASAAAPAAAVAIAAAVAGSGVGASPSPLPAPPATPRTITSVEYLKAPQPDYPAASRRVGEQGKVVLRVLVGETGQAEQVVVQTSSGFERLDEAGRQAVLRARFKPHLEDGRPVAVYVIVPLSFKLGG